MTAQLTPLGYYKWHWQRFRANRRVQKMDYIARGLYRELLDEQWIDGSIPNDIEELADICGCSVETMREKWPSISKCFDVRKGGRLFNRMLENQRTEMDLVRIAQSAGGKTRKSTEISQTEKQYSQDENDWTQNENDEEVRMRSTMPLDIQIERQCMETIGHVEDKKIYNKELKAAIRQYGHDEVLAAWESWIGSQSGFTGKRPVSSFIRNLGTLTTVPSSAQIAGPSLNDVEREIAVITDSQVFFHTQQKPLLASLVKTYSKEEVLAAFQDFWESTDEYGIPWAAKTFMEQCSVRIDAARVKKQYQKSKEKQLKASLAAARQQIENETEEEVEDEL